MRVLFIVVYFSHKIGNMTSRFSTITVPDNVSIVPVDTRVVQKVLYLPVVSTNQGRLLFFKDYYGPSSNSTITFSTIGTDTIDDFNFRYTFSNAFGSMAFISDGGRSWRTMNLYDGSLTPIIATFTPRSITGLQLWLDGSDSTTLSLSGTSVTQWRDKSGLGNNTSAAAGTNTYTTNAINGLSAVMLNNSYLTGPFATTYTGTQVQAFAVATLTTSSGVWGRVLSLGRPGVNDYNVSDTTFMIIRFNGGQAVGIGRSGSYLSVGIPAYSTPFIVQSSHNGATESIGVNGTLTPSSQNTGVGSGFNITSYGIGTNTNTGDATYWAGYVGEVIYYTGVLTTLQIQQIEGYLAWKWGLQANLPSGHPYKNSAP